MSADTILGIDPGTRFVGIAVLSNGKLIQYQVKSFPGIWSQAKLRGIMSALSNTMEQHRVTHVAVKIPDVLPASLGYTQLIGTLNALCERKSIKQRYYTLTEIKLRWCKDAVNSRDLMVAITLKYPDLMLEYLREMKNEEAYYYKIFEAIAAAQMTLWKE